MNKILIICGGVINLLLAGFHLAFWKIFDWPESLLSLSPINLGIMQVINIHLAFVVLVFAYISIIHHQELLSTKLGKSIVVSIIIFYILRAINQLVFWDIYLPDTALMVILCLVVAGIYAKPLLSSTRK
jgi:hypothetical protein